MDQSIVHSAALAEFGLEREAVGGRDPLAAGQARGDDDLIAVGAARRHRHRAGTRSASARTRTVLSIDRSAPPSMVPRCCGRRSAGTRIDALTGSPTRHVLAGIVEGGDDLHEPGGLVENRRDEGHARLLPPTGRRHLDTCARLNPAGIGRRTATR